MNNTEGFHPDPLADMMVEELDALCRQFKDIVENLGDLILPEWSSALDITNEIHRLREAVDDHSLNQSWFSAHAIVES
jgi:hypothetical protein